MEHSVHGKGVNKMNIKALNIAKAMHISRTYGDELANDTMQAINGYHVFKNDEYMDDIEKFTSCIVFAEDVAKKHNGLIAEAVKIMKGKETIEIVTINKVKKKRKKELHAEQIKHLKASIKVHENMANVERERLKELEK